MRALPWLMIALASAFLGAGCLQSYQVTLQNGATLTTRSRPKLDRATDTYRFKDSQNQPVAIPAHRVRQIEPL